MDPRIQLDTIHKGFDGKTCWVQCRAGTIPPGGAGANRLPIVVLTMQKLLLSGSDIFYELTEMRTDDLGKTWSGPTPHPDTLGRRTMPGGLEAVICDATPHWHAATGKLLSTGHVAHYQGNRLAPDPRPRKTAYSVYDPANRTWTPWSTVDMPDPEGCFFNSGAGSAQRFDLENGDILLPIYFMPQPKPGEHPPKHYQVTVMRCRFDGHTLRYLEHGTDLTAPDPRGMCEPSLIRFGGRFFLTLRNDVRGYVARGPDGLHFDPPVPWCFDDGTELGNYNTQQHWIANGKRLFLAYTRRGLNNDHVFRHRAPLVMAEVDPDRLCVIRSTEQVLVPEHGARLGNFAVTDVSRDETWVTVSEWMQTTGPDHHDFRVCQRYGSDNRVFASRILWKPA